MLDVLYGVTGAVIFTCDAALTSILDDGADTSSGKGILFVLGDGVSSGTNYDIMLWTGNVNAFVVRYARGQGLIRSVKLS